MSLATCDLNSGQNSPFVPPLALRRFHFRRTLITNRLTQLTTRSISVIIDSSSPTKRLRDHSSIILFKVVWYPSARSIIRLFLHDESEADF